MSEVCEIEKNTSAQNVRSLFDQAMRRLAQREYGEDELRLKLRAYSDNSADIEVVIEQMKQAGQLSDERFIEAYIQSRVRRGFGPIRITTELRQKGIPEIRLTTSLAIWESSWLALAKRVLEKKYSHGRAQHAKIEDLDEKNLMLTKKRFLLYRGFDHETIHQIFSEIEPKVKTKK